MSAKHASKKKFMLNNSTKLSLLILLPKQKPKQFPPSILLPFPFPPTLKEKQQPAQAIKTPSLFTALVPKGQRSSLLPTNLLPKTTTTSCKWVIFIGLPRVLPTAFVQKPPPFPRAFHLWGDGPRETGAAFGYLPACQMQGGVSAALALQYRMMSKPLFFS